LEKLSFGGGLLLCCVLLPFPGGLLAFALVTAITLLGARIAPLVYLRVLAAPLVFIAMGALTMLVSLEWRGSPWPSPHWAAQEAPLVRLVVSRAVGACACLVFIGLTTPMADILGLLRSRWLVEIRETAALVYRFLFLFLETAAAMRCAQEARLGYATPRLSIRSLGMLAGNLFVRVLARARRLETGLALRGFEGQLTVLPIACSLSWPVIGAGCLCNAGVVLITLWWSARL
jgi:cobalt/nickel transport system permease protein